jgi:hypothetical protein
LSLPGASYFVTVAGLGGAVDYETQFSKWAADLDKQLQSSGPDVHIVALTASAATKQGVHDALTRLATEIGPDDAFGLFLIGHGTFDGEEYKFNVPGPDITARELSQLVNRIPARRQLVVNMTSCSGASFTSLARKDRIVVTATKSGTEKNAPVFARFWVDALKDPAADTDKNGTISALEAFSYAQKRTSAYFEAEKLLATEHAMMTDTGKTAGVRDATPSSGEGLLASAFPLVRPASVGTTTAASPAKQRLFAKKEDLEAKIDRLKYQKAALAPDVYKQELGSLLLELARTQAEIDK